jgi:hypothetical protein
MDEDLVIAYVLLNYLIVQTIWRVSCFECLGTEGSAASYAVVSSLEAKPEYFFPLSKKKHYARKHHLANVPVGRMQTHSTCL